MDDIVTSSVETIPQSRAAALFSSPDYGSEVFREYGRTLPVPIDDRRSYMPWGEDNSMPFDIIRLIESDETLSTCQMFNAELCYGSGLQYDTGAASADVAEAVRTFFIHNDISAYFLGVSQDIKHFAFCVTVLILSADGRRIVRLGRKSACYCRFAPSDSHGNIPFVHYANWRQSPSPEDIETIPCLPGGSPLAELRRLIETGDRRRKFSVISRVPTPDSTYYPIPYYASLFRGKWFKIKHLIATAKEAKLRNSAPIKYHIEVSNKYWEGIFRAEAITDRAKQQARVVEEKERILDFLTGAENSGKVWFSSFYTDPTGTVQHDVQITKIDSSKQGGDWESDIQEAVNMVCFTMRVHSNLVGSVPGKGQTNNSGSDKRELYTIAQALQKPYHDILFRPHWLVIAYNQWEGVQPVCPFIQLTTLAEHRDSKEVKI